MNLCFHQNRTHKTQQQPNIFIIFNLFSVNIAINQLRARRKINNKKFEFWKKGQFCTAIYISFYPFKLLHHNLLQMKHTTQQTKVRKTWFLAEITQKSFYLLQNSSRNLLSFFFVILLLLLLLLCAVCSIVCLP